MNIRIRYFASLKERLGRHEETREVPGGTSPRALLREVLESAGAGDYAPPVVFAVNLAYVSGEESLSDGDEVAFLPPVSGG